MGIFSVPLVHFYFIFLFPLSGLIMALLVSCWGLEVWKGVHTSRRSGEDLGSVSVRWPKGGSQRSLKSFLPEVVF